MIIKGNTYDNIGTIRAKPLRGSELELRWQLSIYPTGGFGVLQSGDDPVSFIEVEVSHDEIVRISCVVPQLLSVYHETIAAGRRASKLLPKKQAAGKRSGGKPAGNAEEDSHGQARTQPSRDKTVGSLHT